MNTTYIIDNIPTAYQEPVRDSISNTQHPTSNTQTGITSIQQPTELGEALKELNKDVIEGQTRTSSIDMRSILHPVQVHPVSAFEGLVVMGMITKKCLGFSRQIKRNAVSINGEGRRQIVQTTQGKTEVDINKAGGVTGGFMSRFFGGGGKKE